MLSHLALRQLATSTGPSAFPPSLLPCALILFADLDLSLPRALVPAQLDHRYGWPAGRARRLLVALERSGLLIPIGNRGLYRLAPAFTWSPRTLAEQWRRERGQGEREGQAGAQGA